MLYMISRLTPYIHVYYLAYFTLTITRLFRTAKLMLQCPSDLCWSYKLSGYNSALPDTDSRYQYSRDAYQDSGALASYALPLGEGALWNYIACIFFGDLNQMCVKSNAWIFFSDIVCYSPIILIGGISGHMLYSLGMSHATVSGAGWERTRLGCKCVYSFGIRAVMTGTPKKWVGWEWVSLYMDILYYYLFAWFFFKTGDYFSYIFLSWNTCEQRFHCTCKKSKF